MRRKSAEVLVGDALYEPLPDLSPEILVAALEPWATETRRARLKEVFDRRLSAVTVLADTLHDPHNGAAIVRSCDAFGVARIHAIERLEPFAAAATVSRGSQKWVEIVRHRDAQACIAALVNEGYELVSTHPQGELRPEDLATMSKVALVLGNERHGIGDDLAAACTRSVAVPMSGFVESLNVSVTAAILLHAATRNRPGDLPEARRAQLYARGLYLSIPQAAAYVDQYLTRMNLPKPRENWGERPRTPFEQAPQELSLERSEGSQESRREGDGASS